MAKYLPTSSSVSHRKCKIIQSRTVDYFVYPWFKVSKTPHTASFSSMRVNITSHSHWRSKLPPSKTFICYSSVSQSRFHSGVTHPTHSTLLHTAIQNTVTNLKGEVKRLYTKYCERILMVSVKSDGNHWRGDKSWRGNPANRAEKKNM
jgi:hypothetical protein